ncbi:hypothetical protein MHU86_12119 [Fragilaria crotonensis]|nr:hypothetical protein MHU86_12119 [Fragilaria crotonensis]
MALPAAPVLVAGGAAIPAPPPAPTSYRELYSDATNSPPLDRTAAYLASYRFTDAGLGAVPTPAVLRDQAVALSDRQPMAFLALTTGPDGTPEVVILHRLLRYLDIPGDDPSGYNDRVLGLVGDILPHQYPVVECPNTAFHLVNTAIRVPTVEAMETLLPTWADPQVALGPYNEEDAETELIRPRHIQLVPGRYAALLVHRRRIKAKQAYQELYVTAKVHRDLPGIGATAEGALPGATATLLGALRALTDRRDATTEGGAPTDVGGQRMAARESKTIVDAYKETYLTLLRYGNVNRPEDVAPVWIRLANCSKSEQHIVLSQELQRVCMARGLSTEIYNPVITATLKQMVSGLQFEGHGADDLTSGCQPFLVSYAGSTSHYQAVAAASIANQLSQGEQSASLSDYREIREKERIKFPRDISEVCITLLRYAVLCQGLFQGVGPPHPFVEAMWGLASSLQNMAPFVTERFALVAGTPQIANTYFSRILRTVQLSVYEYLQQVGTNVADGVNGIPLPSFASLLQDLKRGTFHLSTNWVAIPDEYLTPSVQTGVARNQGSIAGSGNTIATPTTGSTHSVVSSVTGDTSRTPVAREENPRPDADFTSLTMRPGGIRNVLRTHRPANNDSGNEFCVAWWTKGACFANCGRRATHAPFASPGERTRLLAYVREHLVAPANTGT